MFRICKCVRCFFLFFWECVNTSEDGATARAATGVFYRDSSSLEEAIRRGNEIPGICHSVMHYRGTNKETKSTGTILKGGRYFLTAAHALCEANENIVNISIGFLPNLGEIDYISELHNSGAQLSTDQQESLSKYKKTPQPIISRNSKIWICPGYKEGCASNDIAIAEIYWLAPNGDALSIDDEKISSVINVQSLLSLIELPLSLSVGKRGFVPTYAKAGIWGHGNQVLQRALSIFTIDDIQGNELYSRITPEKRTTQRWITLSDRYFLERDGIIYPAGHDQRLRAVTFGGCSGSPFVVKTSSQLMVGGVISLGTITANKTGITNGSVCIVTNIDYIASDVITTFTAEHLEWFQRIFSGKESANYRLGY